MTLRQALLRGREILAQSAFPGETPDLDARILLSHASGLSPERLILDAPLPIEEKVFQDYLALLEKRSAGWPVAYLTGTKEFMGLDFAVGEGLLVPRPDTETLVEAALAVLREKREKKDRPLQVLDVCSGTGCVGISLAVHSGSTDGEGFFACDLSPVAVKTTKQNALRHGLTAYQVSESDLLSAWMKKAFFSGFDLIVSNPPYLTPQETRLRIENEGWKEPSLALDGGGEDGLALVRLLIGQAAQKLVPGGVFMIEAAPPQGPAILQSLREAGFVGLKVFADLAGLERVWKGTLASSL